jgi:hypothetical protein
MAGSTLVEIKRSIADHLDTVLFDWVATYSWPGDRHVTRRSIWCGGTTAQVETTSIRANRRRRTEEPTVTVAFWAEEIDAASTPAERQEAADAAVFAALTVLDEWIADDGQLGRPDLVDLAWLDRWTHDVGPTERGEAALITAEIRYQARLL